MCCGQMAGLFYIPPTPIPSIQPVFQPFTPRSNLTYINVPQSGFFSFPASHQFNAGLRQKPPLQVKTMGACPPMCAHNLLSKHSTALEKRTISPNSRGLEIGSSNLSGCFGYHEADEFSRRRTS